jgi:hypothetical protein
MKKPQKSPIPDTYTAARFASLTGIDRHELQKRLEEQQAQPTGTSAQGGGKLYTLRSLAAAFAGGDHEAERRAKTRAERERLELQNARTRGEMVEVQAVKKLGERIMIAIRSKILQSHLSDDEKDKVLLDLMSLGKMDWTRDA